MKSERIDVHRLQDLGEGIKIARSNAVKDVTLMSIATQYRRDVSRAYIQLSEEDIEARFPEERQYAISRKYNGEAVFIYFDDSEDVQAFAFNAPSGRLRVGLKALDELVDCFKKANISKALITGECYLKRDGDGPTPNHSDILRASFRNNSDEQNRISLAIYDIIMLDGRDWRSAENGFLEVWEKMGNLFSEDDSRLVHRVKGEISAGSKVKELFLSEVEAKEEGIVVRRLDKLEVFKVKPMLTIDAVVIGYVEDQVENTYGIASLLVALTVGNYYREFARIGSGFSDEERVRLLKELSTEKIEAPLSKTDSDGRPVQFVKPRFIVEVRGESLESERISGQENVTPTYEISDNSYTFLGSHSLPRLIHATFNCMREDKDLASGGARLAQVLDSEAEDQFELGASKTSESKIVARRVFTKTSKDGAISLRKFVLVHTDGIGRYPFCILYTDISLGRKQPIQTTLKVSNTSELADQLLEEMIQDNIKKGWIEDGKEAAEEKPKTTKKKTAKKAAKKATKKKAKES